MSFALSKTFTPPAGWDRFQRSEELEARLWAALPQEGWHYLNFTRDSSVWESRQDGSSVSVEFQEGRICGVSVNEGVAMETFHAIAEVFGLRPEGS